jgi:hypothetical protein
MSEKNFGVSDIEYDIVTTLSNLLQGEDVLYRYESDARAVGDDEVVRIFVDLRTSNKRHARALREALVRRLAG